MANLEQDLREDRMLRDAAKRLVKADIGFLKGDMAEKGIGARIADRAKDGAAEMADDAAHYAGTYRTEVGTGVVVAILAILGWIFRDRLADAVYSMFHEQGPLEEAAEKAEQVAKDARSFFD